MQKRVTLRQIAARAGVHLSTVSLAMRDDPKLPPKTRERIRALARKMGYVPDPALNALCAYRNAQRPRAVQSGLAYLTDMPHGNRFSDEVYAHARAQAARLGYNLIEYNLRSEGASLNRFRTIWWNSGLRGVLIGPFVGPTVLEGPWDRWPVVAYGYSVTTPQFNRAVLHHFQNMLLHLQTLRDLGYKRIGLCLLPGLDSRTEGQLRAAYLLDCDNHPLKSPPTVLTEDNITAERLDRWVTEERLDVVIGYREHHDMLVARGWKIPEKLGFSLLTLRNYELPGGGRLAGFDSRAELLAENAVNFLVSLLHEHVYGLSHPPRYYMISGEFVPGNSLRVAV
jgi:Transcriptional regulators